MTKRDIRIVSQRSNLEGPMTNNEWLVTLKDGALVDARVARTVLQCLREDLASNSGMVRMLHQHAIGDEECPQHWRDELQGSYFHDNELLPVAKAILLNGLDVTAGELKVVDPFDHNAETDHVLATIRENEPLMRERFLRKLLGDPGQLPPGRSR